VALDHRLGSSEVLGASVGAVSFNARGYAEVLSRPLRLSPVQVEQPSLMIGSNAEWIQKDRPREIFEGAVILMEAAETRSPAGESGGKVLPTQGSR